MLTFLDHLAQIEEELREKTPVMFLDYDGTLTPIVATPDLAVLSEDMRAIVQKLATRYKVSIVSGRATDDVRSKVKLENIFYAGSHGFEIVHPDGKTTIHPEAAKMRATIEEVYARVHKEIKDIPGALVEDVKYTISVHYRLVSDNDFPKIKAVVTQVLKDYPQLRKTDGKKVFELRPRIDWDKGKAVRWIMEALAFDPAKNTAIYIGDDTTDEDAFAEIKDKGFGILVAEQPKETQAKYLVHNVDEVKKTLEYFCT